jgi:type IV secretory pathway VirB2 component (pilin)
MTDISNMDASSQGSQGAPAAAPGGMQSASLSTMIHGVLGTTAGQIIAVLIVVIAGIWLLKYLGEELT